MSRRPRAAPFKSLPTNEFAAKVASRVFAIAPSAPPKGFFKPMNTILASRREHHWCCCRAVLRWSRCRWALWVRLFCAHRARTVFQTLTRSKLCWSAVWRFRLQYPFPSSIVRSLLTRTFALWPSGRSKQATFSLAANEKHAASNKVCAYFWMSYRAEATIGCLPVMCEPQSQDKTR
jgi:hypothetical protein